MLNEVINMISVVDVCYVALFAIGTSVVVDTIVHWGEES